MWLSGVERIPGNSAGSMAGGGQKKILLHTTEGSSIEGAVSAYQSGNSWPTLTVDCPRRRVVEHLDLTVAARSLKNLSGGVETNRQGSILVQIEMVGFAQNPSTIGSTADLAWFADTVMAQIAGLTGAPLTSTVHWVAYPASYGQSASQRLSSSAWSSYSGVCGHQHAPENDHGDPGAIDISTILSGAQGGDMPLTDDDINKLITALTPFVESVVDDKFAFYSTRTFSWLTTGHQNSLCSPSVDGWGFVDDAGTFTLNEVAVKADLADMPAVVADAVVKAVEEWLADQPTGVVIDYEKVKESVLEALRQGTGPK